MTDAFGAEFVNLENYSFPPELLSKIPAPIARSYQVVPLDYLPAQPHPLLKVAMGDPSDLDALSDLSSILRCELLITVANAAQLQEFVDKLYPKPE